jgi:hypothetical protein
MLVRIDHVQLAMPPRGEAAAEESYSGVRWSEEVPGTVRCHLDDPFGNRLELIDAESLSS